MNAFHYTKEALLTRLHTIGFHLNSILEKAKLYGQKTEDCQGFNCKGTQGILESDRIIPYSNVLKSDKIAF